MSAQPRSKAAVTEGAVVTVYPVSDNKPLEMFYVEACSALGLRGHFTYRRQEHVFIPWGEVARVTWPKPPEHRIDLPGGEAIAAAHVAARAALPSTTGMPFGRERAERAIDRAQQVVHLTLNEVSAEQRAEAIRAEQVWDRSA